MNRSSLEDLDVDTPFFKKQHYLKTLWIPDPNFACFYPKKLFLSSWKNDLGRSARIRIFLPSQIKIRNTAKKPTNRFWPTRDRRGRSSPAHLIRGGDVAVLDAVGGGDSVGRVPGGGWRLVVGVAGRSAVKRLDETQWEVEGKARNHKGKNPTVPLLYVNYAKI